MSALLKTFQGEISRLARKETRTLSQALRKSAGASRRALAELKCRVDELERQIKVVGTLRVAPPQVASDGETVESKRGISGKGVRGLRRKLGLTQGAFAKLVGVTPHGVFLWEHKNGMLKVRGAPGQALLALREMAPSKVRKLLAEKGIAPAGRKRQAAKK